jgi:hypothetical protein
MYTSYFEDVYSNVSSKQISHLELAHLLYDYLPLIDEQKKQRPKILGLERKWPMRNYWLRFLTTLMGMWIVDVHQIYSNLWNKRYTYVDVLEFSDFICMKLVIRSRRQHERLAALTWTINADNASVLERMTNNDGNSRFVMTDNQARWWRDVGKSMHLNCFICCKYLTPMGETENVQTTFRCSDCKMPLFKKDWSNLAIGQNQSCLDERKS